jgi:hypothetical protein
MNSKDKNIKQIKLLDSKTGFEYLEFMCKNVRNKSSALRAEVEPMTDRVTFIVDCLNKLDLNYKLIPFSCEEVNDIGYNKAKLVNVQVFFKSSVETKKTIIYTAHHDISNAKSENCQDNSASVCNLIHFCSEISKMKHRNRNVFVVFTDCEEYGGRGAQKLCDMIHKGELGDIIVEGVVGLELTACGDNLWAEPVEEKDSFVIRKIKKFKEHSQEKLHYFRTPYNECMTIRRNGIDAVCIGILPDADVEQLNNGKYAINWALCHSELDTFEKSANKEDMNALVCFLKRFINE